MATKTLRSRMQAAVRAFAGIAQIETPYQLLPGVSSRDAPKRTAKNYLEAYSTIPWLRAVTHRISSSTATVRWQLYGVRRQGRFRRMPTLQGVGFSERQTFYRTLKQQQELIELDDHPLLTLLNGMNPMLTGYATKKLTQIYLDLIGEGGWLLQRNRAGVPEHAWPIPPTWVHALPTPAHPAYEVSYGGWYGHIPVTEMVWFCDLNPSNPYGRGSGTAQALGDELDADEYAAKFVRSWFYNRARPDMIIAPKDNAAEINTTSLARLKERWLEEHQGFWKVARPFFSSRAIDVHEVGQTFEQMQLLELRKFERDMCIEIFGVPPEILGIIEASKKATITEAETIYGRRVIEPRLELQRSVLQTRLVPEYDDRLILDYASPVPEDEEYALRAAQAAPYTLTANEWRAKQGLPARDDGHVFFVPFSVIAQSTLGGVVPGTRQNGQRQINGHATATPIAQKQRHVDAEPDDDFYLVLHQIADRIEPRLRREFVDALGRARGQIDVDALQAALASGQYQAAVDALPWEALSAEVQQALQEGLQQAVQAAGDVTAQQMDQSLDITIAFDQEDPRAREWAETHALELASEEGLVGESRRAVQGMLTDALENGAQPGDLQEQITQTLGLTRNQQRRLQRFRTQLQDEGVSGDQLRRRAERFADALRNQRAETIVRTELINAVSEGQQQAWQQADDAGLIVPNLRRFWVVTPDDRLDPDCEGIPSRNSNGVGLHEPFQTPVGPRMRPTIHPNCRCAVSLRRVES